MTREKPLSIADITQELNSGTATIKFILNRFNTWFPFNRTEGHHYYSRNAIPILIKIQGYLDAGMLPSQIDQALKTDEQAISDFPINTATEKNISKLPSEEIRVGKDGLNLIKSLFDDIALQQNRVAAAHEKRAEAEERKATAIEKRAEAEEKKAIAMNKIAMALQEMNQHKIHDPQSREMAFQTAQGLAMDETNPEVALPDTGQQDFPAIFDSPDPPFDLLESSEIDMDDLSNLIEGDLLQDDPLVDVQNIPNTAQGVASENKTELDDLSALLDQNPTNPGPIGQRKTEEMHGMDNLSQLIDEPSPSTNGISDSDMSDMDDLSNLIDTVSNPTLLETSPLIDDLSLLIDDLSSLDTQVDNLSLLIEPQFDQANEPPMTPSQIPVAIDDLSLLIEPDSLTSDPLTSEALAPMDDLNEIISTPSLKPDITPQEDLKAYKAAVMKTILHLKTKGLNAKESTKRLNQDGVPTISGKSEWSEKAISQIYSFMDSAR